MIFRHPAPSTRIATEQAIPIAATGTRAITTVEAIIGRLPAKRGRAWESKGSAAGNPSWAKTRIDFDTDFDLDCFSQCGSAEIAFVGTMNPDNIFFADVPRVTVIPEPAAADMLALALTALTLRRKRV